jgi:hypothetical protein
MTVLRHGLFRVLNLCIRMILKVGGDESMIRNVSVLKFWVMMVLHFWGKGEFYWIVGH